ncbi:MAG: NAD-dependent epimerase/dehydratase family protein [Nitrosotalea sp.]
MAHKKNKIIVTGSNGFIGNQLVQKLKNEGYEVIDSIGNKKIDVTNFEQLKKIEKSDAIVHLAAEVGIEKSYRSTREFFMVNTVGTLNMLEISKIKKIPKFIYVSSYMYGKPNYLPIDESHPINPHSPYNESKYLGERICKIYSETYGIKTIILRPFCVFGPFQNKEDFFIPKIVNNMLKGLSLEIVNGHNRRDYLYVDDFVDVIIKCLSYNCLFEIFNVGSGKSYSFFDIKNYLESITDKIISFKEITSSESQIKEIIADVSKITTKLKWHPKTDMKLGLKEILALEYSMFIDR